MNSVSNTVSQRDTLSCMTKLIAFRLPEDLYEVVSQLAKEQERSVSQIIVRALRQAFEVSTSRGPVMAGEIVSASAPLTGKPRYLKCMHNANEYTCERPACKIKSGRA
jgi:hypothetical protein